MNDWWKGAAIYQVYPRSFYDSNHDGVGDLPGVIERLDHIATLGVDAIWLSPFFVSPMRDFGYDISDFRDVDPVFGTLDDFDTLVRCCHERGLKIIIDQVYSHTSDRHPWFLESRASADNPHADWYVWADARLDGSPPTNWLSYFGGPAWSWDTRRRKYYLHNFLAEQPDLNFHNPEVRAAMLDVARFWLDRGVDGFRLDAANYYYHDAELRDNPPSDAPEPRRPYHFQTHLYNRSRPENLEFLRQMRALLDQYDARMSVAEIASSKHMQRTVEYTQGPDRLHTAYNFIFLETDRLTPGLLRHALEPWDGVEAWPSWSFSNHDVKRAVTRWGGSNPDPGFARVLMALLATLRGTIFVYQGEELGLPQADIPFERLRDPEAIRFWPENLGRDGSRSPMPWAARSLHSGFSTVEPWLPVDPRHAALAVDEQARDPDSTLNFTRRMLALRRQFPVLRSGGIVFHEAGEHVLSFERSEGQQRVLCMFNATDFPQRAAIPTDLTGARVLDTGLGGRFEDGEARLPGHGGLIAVLEQALVPESVDG
ncbi:MAG: alpha glucosidase [Wenzhouxiangellaceae bacterium]|nr:alpha glucosidase [Wenzhouxiangellaceae bacterium]